MLKKKMIRDIKQNLSQFITIFLMVFIGVMAYSGIESYMSGMEYTANRFYSENNLQDLNVYGNLNKKDLEDIKKLNNINDASGKLSLIATSKDTTLSLNFIENNSISKFYIIDGKDFENSSGVWLDSFYADLNNLQVGDTISIKYDGYTFEEKIVGLINVPDHIYDVKDESELYPNHKEYGFAYLSIVELEKYIKYNLEKEYGNLNQINIEDYITFNYIMVEVDDTKNTLKVKEEIEKQIENASAVIKIEDTASYKTYQGEIDEGKTYIGVFSGLFIFIAVLAVITTMTRVVKRQKIQIGTLKALGFKNYKIIIHYLSYGFFISLLAVCLGLLCGYYVIGNLFMNMEMSFFEIPNGYPVIETSSFICAFLVILCVLVVTFITCFKYLNKTAAETLRNEIPKVKTKSLNLTTKGLFSKLDFKTKWNIRDMLRNKIRTITGIVGITGCTMLIVCAFGMLDSMNHFIELQFHTLYNFDYKLSIKSNISENSLNDLLNEYGNNTSKSYLIEIKDDLGNKKSNNIFITDTNYVRFIDDKENFIDLDSNGVYITYKLAENLNYKIGDTITWHIMGSDTYYKSKIIGFNKDPQNQNMTMTKEYFESLGNSYTPDSLYTNNDLKGIKEIENIELIQSVNDLESGMDMMLKTMRSMIILIIFIAVLLGTVIIYNMGVLSYTEKQYQFATLKVLGFSSSKIKSIFIKQNNIITFIAIILGLPLGYYLTDWLFKTAIEESYDFSAYITVYSYIFSALGTFIVSYIVSHILSKKINNIDMVTSLKGNE